MALTHPQIKDGWFTEKATLWPGQAMSIEVHEILHVEKSLYQDVLVFQSKTYGNVLVLDGVIQATERDEFAYQEMITHIPMMAHPCPKKVLVIGGGDGGVLREVVKHECVEEAVLCDIDESVIRVSKKYLPHMAVGFQHPKVKVHIGDGFKFMADYKDTFDVIITDSSDPVGPAESLYQREYFQLMKGALREGGIISTQGECQWLHLDLIKEVKTFALDLFPKVEYAYSTVPTYPSGQIGYMICSLDKDNDVKNPTRQWSEEEEAKLCRYYNKEMHKASFLWVMVKKEYTRPARTQVTEEDLQRTLEERRPAGSTYNIWSHKWRGGDREFGVRTRAKYRCDPARDSGITAGSTNPDAYFCLYFARGMCAYGKNCANWHRVPDEQDHEETTIDCFGRDKFVEFKQDMGGVGSFNLANTTLYVGKMRGLDDRDEMERIIRKHFEPWGEIAAIYLLNRRGVAFITYKTRMNAEFAKEAMSNQSLEHNEIINVRWASQNPNPDPDEIILPEENKRKFEEIEIPDIDPELPAEFTQPEQEENEDEEHELERKRVKAEEYAQEHQATGNVYANYHQGYYTPDGTWVQYDYGAAYAPQEPEKDTKSNSIVPESVLDSLKKMREKTAANTKTNGAAPATLGNLTADYGSSDEE
ncbi:hypothetical protein BZG36_01214 [Bifiguratus adelaidae]|uniref:PABS domain-containing protein n=1 Tax=Bifiguratus adelaidae TaxID=1938954 RepID=A0A261Y5T4_9FUNG|nr:hypothetical protein BZG36_01214 [Bifiguratus adelaidae]